MAGAEAVSAGVAAADDHDAFACRRDLVGDCVAFAALVGLREELHREMDSGQLASGDVQVARLFGAAGKEYRVEFPAQVFDRDIRADMRVGLELHPLGAHLLQAPVDEVLLHLEIGDTVAEESADTVGFLEDRDVVAGARELLGGGESGGSGADYGDTLAGLPLGGLGLHMAGFESAVDDGFLDALDADRRLVDAEHARGLAWRGTQAPGELREIIGGVQLACGFSPGAAV